MKSINARLDEMTKKLSSKDLFESNGLGNEINFHVFDFVPLFFSNANTFSKNPFSFKISIIMSYISNTFIFNFSFFNK